MAVTNAVQSLQKDKTPGKSPEPTEGLRWKRTMRKIVRCRFWRSVSGNSKGDAGTV